MQYNTYFIVVLIIVVGLYVFDLVANWLNLSSLSTEVPDEFAEVFDASEYKKSQDYTRTTTRYEFITDTFGLLVFLAFWLSGGFGWLDELVRSWVSGEVTIGILYIVLLVMGQYLISLPFSLYDTFVIEERFGFNKMTIGTFLSDQVKSLLLQAIIGIPILALLLWLFNSQPNAWLYAWLSMTAISLLMTYLAPTLIMPLFNKFEPLEEGELKTEIDRLSNACQFPLTEVSVMDGSKRSSKSNAFFTGFGKNKKIALYDTLIKNHSVQELVAVLAHEIGHFKKKHILQQIVIGIVQIGVFSFMIKLILNNPALMAAFGVEQVSVHCSFVFFAILFKPVSLLLSIAMNLLSRKNEFEADAYAAEVTKHPTELITALKKLSKDNLSNLTPHPFYVFMFYSHPPVIERISALRRSALI